jgi:hypothetical protein
MANNQTKLDRLVPNLFKDGPGEYLASSIAQMILKEPHFKQIFDESVDDYDREDYSLRELPACRIYTTDYTKEQESHYINGNIKMDVIFPADLRRGDTEKYPSRVASAMLQQFRRPPFFAAMQLTVPGLNELGKVFRVEKNLTFQNTQMTDECPVVQITLNFRIDQKQWDEYLESQGRTKDDPFDVTLADLEEIVATIQAIRNEVGEVPVDINLGTDQKV